MRVSNLQASSGPSAGPSTQELPASSIGSSTAGLSRRYFVLPSRSIHHTYRQTQGDFRFVQSLKLIHSDWLRAILKHLVFRRTQRCWGARTDVTEAWWNKNNPDNMVAIDSVQEFVDELADSGDNLVIVDFYAKWCHACRSLFPKLCQICRDNADLKLLKIDWDENKDVAKTLGVKVLPFFLLYRGAEGKVAEFSCSVAKVQRLRDAIEAHGAARCSLGLNPTLQEYFPDAKPSHQMDRHEITILSSTGDSVLSRSMASFDDELDDVQPQPVA